MHIIKLEAENEQGLHLMQSQSHREECWLSGYAAVPPALVEAAISCGGYCDLTLEAGALIDILPKAPPQTADMPETDPLADMDAMLVDLEFRLTLLELEVI